MNRDDINECTVTGFVVNDSDRFAEVVGAITPKALLDASSEPFRALMGIPVRVSKALPPNKIAICDESGIIGFFDMEPEPPEMT